MKTIASVITAAAILAGCATTGANWSPVVDRPGVNYSTDLAECQQHATRVMSAADGAVGGAVAGALFGALLSAAVGGGRYTKNFMAAGALSGATSAASAAEGGQRGIIRRCLAGRGYSVLN